MSLFQLAADGLALGAVYALTTLGFVLVLNGIAGINFAHGDLAILGGFIGIGLSALLPDWPAMLLLPAVAVLMALAGLVLSAAARHPGSARYFERVHLVTFATGIMIATILASAYGAAPRHGVPLVADGAITLLDGQMSRQSLIVIAAAAIFVPAVHLLLSSTQFGRRLRAAAQDPELARTLGIDTRRMRAATFALATALAGIAGVMLADRFAAAPMNGIDLTTKAYIALAIAGWGRVLGAAAVALLFGVCETAGAALGSALAVDAAIFLLLLVMLALRPEGWLGAAAQRRD